MTNNGNAGPVDVEYLAVAPGRGDIRNRATVSFSDGLIGKIESSSGSNGRGLLAMPALVDAHDHVRGLHHIAFGAKDQTFEVWRAALYAQPPLDLYMNCALAFGRLAQAGVGSVMHVYSSINVERMAEDAEIISRAARDVGVRLALAVPLRDQLTLGYADDEKLLALHDPRDREFIRNTWLYPFPSPRTYMDMVADIARKVEGPTVSVQYGPNSPYACSDKLLQSIAEASARDGRRVTTHILETSLQRRWANATYPKGFVRHLADLGLITERFTGAHGIWLTPDEIRIMAENGAQIAINASSNLRLRSGIAPVSEYIKAGMRFSFGIDSFSIDDDEDAFRELRVGHWLFSLDGSPAPMSQQLLFEGWHRNGYRAVNNKEGYGEVMPGAPGDLVVLNFDSMAYDVIDGMVDPMEVVLTRATTRHVKSLYVAGREIVREGKVLGVDLEAIEREVIKMARARGEHMRSLRPILERTQKTLKSFHEETFPK
ncbi:amidohydrolase family protein [Bradyrhizobium sp. dw_78]|uniref:amidohydrolase family protein n=1 Tax=Bradyrhizobium sp. dw_78 TaxID=2719793 RepID=UPI001BD481D0|nr:amidohydrolase family protein [Bradyrhizobium sp. dw_78]